MTIHTIHIIHHTHTDFGYTDLASTAWRYHTDYCREAIDLAWATRDHDEADRFRWTFEALWPVQRFLKQASDEQRGQLRALIECGQLDAGGMPFHTTALMTRDEWHRLRDDLGELYELFQPTTCFQNDINGLPWGLIPKMLDAGMRYVMMAPNPYSSGQLPGPVPSAFWWEGPDGQRMLTWQGHSYADGPMFFHESDWRRGPVPAHHDIWFDRPDATQLFRADDASLRAAHERLHARLTLLKPYDWSVLPIQVTNAWRADNDPPLPQLCAFVRAWNDARLEPRLTMSTPTRFFEALESELTNDVPVYRGDWVDWWIDGVAQLPTCTALAQRAKQRLSSMPAAANLLNTQTSDMWQPIANEAWRQASLHTEHTFGAYDSVPRPYGKRTMGQHFESAGHAYQADEAAECARAAIIRQSPCYQPTYASNAVLVANPSDTPASGWVTISAQALREPFNAVTDPRHGQTLRFETHLGPEWSDADFSRRPHDAWPDDVWSAVPVMNRFYVHDVPAAQTLTMPLTRVDDMSPDPPNWQGQSGRLAWQWDTTRGEIEKLSHDGASLIDAATEPFGSIIFEQPHGFHGRRGMISHNPHRRRPPITHTPARVTSCQPTAAWYGRLYKRELKHPLCRRITQWWRFLPGDRLELTTTLAFHETVEPYAAFLCLPFDEPDALIRYDSLGYDTVVGDDQLHGSCGEYAAVGQGVHLVSSRRSIGVGCLDTPLVSFDKLHKRSGKTTFTPQTARLYPCLIATYWDTNFPIAKADEYTARHVIAVSSDRPEFTSPSALQADLWAMPTRTQL